MIDPDLERRYADCVELVDAWKHFMDLLARALKAPETINLQLEEQFLNAKARVAMLHDSFTASLKHDKQTGQNMIDIVNRAISLRLMHKANEAEQKKIEIEWHEVFLLLNETVSTLNDRRDELRDRNEFLYNLGKLKERLVASIHNFFTSAAFKWGMAALGVVFVIFGVPAFGIYDYDDLRDVGALKPVLGAYYDFSRSLLGMDQPYIDMETASEVIRSAEDPNNAISAASDDVSKQTFVNSVVPNQIISQQGYSQLQELQGLFDVPKMEYQAWRYHPDSRTSTADTKGYLYVFWYRKKADAQAVENFKTLNPDSVRDGVGIWRKGNLILVGIGQPQTRTGNMEEIRAIWVDKFG